MSRGTTRSVADRMVSKSRRSSPSTKRAKPATNRPFGPKSQFRGVGNGVRGDVRK